MKLSEWWVRGQAGLSSTNSRSMAIKRSLPYAYPVI